MSETPRVSVIIVNWNGAEHLRICLPSLASQTFPSMEIIVVDNHSTDDSADVARSTGVRWLPLDTNIGLAPALNQGAAIASGDLLLFVNNDMRFDPSFVAALAEPFESDENIFATDGMQFNWDGTSREHMMARLTKQPSRDHSSTELVPGLFFHQHERSKASPVFMASAACMMVRRKFFQELGGFDDRLPLGYEDVEICWRAWARQWKTLYVPDAVCWHRVSASTRSREGARYSFRGILKGRLLLATKLLPLRFVLRTWLATIAGLAKDLSRGRWIFVWDRAGVMFRMAGLCPQLLEEKKALFRSLGRSPEEHLDFLLRLTEDDE